MYYMREFVNPDHLPTIDSRLLCDFTHAVNGTQLINGRHAIVVYMAFNHDTPSSKTLSVVLFTYLSFLTKVSSFETGQSPLSDSNSVVPRAYPLSTRLQFVWPGYGQAPNTSASIKDESLCSRFPGTARNGRNKSIVRWQQKQVWSRV